MPPLPMRSLAMVLAVLGMAIGPSSAMAPMPRPVANSEVPSGQAAPFVGAWSMTLPTREASEGDAILVTCAAPIHIEEANLTHIFYLGPDQAEADAAISLIQSGDSTKWEPIAGGPIYVSIWITPDSFYLYDAVSEGEPDWALPYIYNRCL